MLEEGREIEGDCCSQLTSYCHRSGSGPKGILVGG
jgi:hypothetical protein